MGCDPSVLKIGLISGEIRPISEEQGTKGREIMKLANRTKLALAIVAGFLLLSMHVMAQPHGRGIGLGPNKNPARVTPKPTPPGHHYGWQKGKHNPHRM